MTKTDLIIAVAEKSGLKRKEAELAVNAVLETVVETLVEGDRVSLVGFGTFEVRDRSARTGVNPKTGEAIEIAACKVPAFKAGKSLKDAVAK